jgi:hypothetical protein
LPLPAARQRRVATARRAIRLAPGERLVREIGAGLLTLTRDSRLALRSPKDGRLVRRLSGAGRLLATTEAGAVWLPSTGPPRVVYVTGSGRTASLRGERPLVSLAAATSPNGDRVALVTGTAAHTYLTITYLPLGSDSPRRVYYGEVTGHPPYHLVFAPDGDAVYLSAGRTLWEWRSQGPPVAIMTLRREPLRLLPF